MKKQEKQNETDKKKSIRRERFWGSLLVISQIFFAYVFVKVTISSFMLMFDPTQVFSFELAWTVGGLMMTMLAITVCYAVAYYAFRGTRLQKLFPEPWWEKF